MGLLGGDEEDEDVEEEEVRKEEDAFSWIHFSPRALAKWSSTDTLMESCLEEPVW